MEGRYPNIYVSFKIADLVGKREEYVLNKGLKKDVYRKMILNTLVEMQEASVSEIYKVLEGALIAHMNEKQQVKKVFCYFAINEERSGIRMRKVTGYLSSSFTTLI